MEDAAPANASPTVRDRLLAAAVQILHEQGIGALTQTNVSSLAGVRQSHLTYYFPARSDLLKQAVLSGCVSLLAMLEEPTTTGAKSLREFHETALEQLLDRRVSRMMAGLVVASDEDLSLKAWLEQFQADMLNRLERAFAAWGVRPARAELEVFHATFVGALQLDLAASSEASIARTRAIVRTAFDRLVAASGAEAPSPTAANDSSSIGTHAHG